MNNTEAMKLALDALDELNYSSGTVVAARKYESAIAALRQAISEAERVRMKECRHCGWLCTPNTEQSKKWYPLEQPTVKESLTTQDLSHVITSDPLYQMGYDAAKAEQADHIGDANEMVAEQEPVAWMNTINGFICKEKTRGYHVPLYTAPPKPFAAVSRADLKDAFQEGFNRAADLYAPKAEQEPVTFPANGLLAQEPSRDTPTGSQSGEIIQPFAYYCDEFNSVGELIDREYNGINQFSGGRFGKPLYTAPPQREWVSLPKLTDEIIAELWHKSGGHLYKFAKILRDWLQENAS